MFFPIFPCLFTLLTMSLEEFLNVNKNGFFLNFMDHALSVAPKKQLPISRSLRVFSMFQEFYSTKFYI